MSKSLPADSSKEILGHFCEKLKRQGEKLKVFFVVSGSRGDEEKVWLVKEEEKETVLNKLDKVFYSHIYSVQSADLKLEENIPDEKDLSDNLRGSKQTLLSNFIDFKSNRAIFDNSSTASTSSKPSNSKSNHAKQYSMHKFVYKKRNPPANSQWLHKLRLEFNELESKEPLESEELIEDMAKGWNADDFQGVNKEYTDMSEGLEGIVCDWTVDDFEENNEVKIDLSRDDMSEPDGTVFDMIVDIIDEVMDIVSKKERNSNVRENQESLYPTEVDAPLEVSRNCSLNAFPSKNYTFEGEWLEDIVSDWDVDDFKENESDHLEMKLKKRKVCEGGIFEENKEFKREKSREAKVDLDSKASSNDKTPEEEMKILLDDVLDHITYGETGQANPIEGDEQLEVFRISSVNVFPSEIDTFDGELLEDIVSDWDVNDFKGKESDHLEIKWKKRKVCEGTIFEEDKELEACREAKEDLDWEDSKDVKTLEEEMNSSSRDWTLFDDQTDQTV